MAGYTPEPAMAQSPDQRSEAVEMEEITVRATRVEKPLLKIPAAMGVVDQDDIQTAQQQVGLDESLVKIPGLFMQNRFNFAQDLRISIRGFGARAGFGIRGIKILVDDIPETLADGQGQVDSIDLGSAQRIEVIRGSASSLYGNAAGGVISIRSETGPQEPFAETRLSFGEFGFQKYQLKSGGQMGSFNYLLNLSDFRLDGYRDNSRTETTQLNSKFGYTIDGTSDLAAVINLTNSPVADDPGSLTRQQAEDDPSQARGRNVQFDTGEDIDQQRVGLVYHKSFGDKHELMARNYYVWRDFANKLPFTDGGAVTFDRFFFGGGLKYTFTGALQGKQNRVILGIDVDRQDDDRRRFDNNMGVIGALALDQNEKVTSTGVFVQDEFQLLENLELTLGARQDWVRFKVDDDFLSDGDDSGSQTLDEFSPMVGILYSVSPAVNLYGNISQSFETPTTSEFANPSGGGGFNSNLEPQTATNYEVGIKGTLPHRIGYGLSLFTVDVKDELIPFEIPGMPDRDFFVNAGRSTRDGLEASVSVQPLAGLTASAAYTLSDFTFDRFTDNNGNVFDGNDIPGIPQNLLHGEIAYLHSSGFYVVADVLNVDDFYVNNANTEKNDSYTVANLRATYTLLTPLGEDSLNRRRSAISTGASRQDTISGSSPDMA
jgi:iron complex outermembrane receptor protein